MPSCSRRSSISEHQNTLPQPMRFFTLFRLLLSNHSPEVVSPSAPPRPQTGGGRRLHRHGGSPDAAGKGSGDRKGGSRAEATAEAGRPAEVKKTGGTPPPARVGASSARRGGGGVLMVCSRCARTRRVRVILKCDHDSQPQPYAAAAGTAGRAAAAPARTRRSETTRKKA